MRINFEWQNIQKTEQKGSSFCLGAASGYPDQGRVGSSPDPQTVLDFSPKVGEGFVHPKGSGFNGEVLQKVGTDAYLLLQRNFHAVMSNSMSARDYLKMEKEGFDVYRMEPDEVVTILDRIKAELARSGTTVEGYTDSLSTDKLEQITGSRAYANRISKALEEANVPVTRENIQQVGGVLTQAQRLAKPKEGELVYLAANGMEPTLENLYKASYSSVHTGSGENAAYSSGNYGRQGEKHQQVRRTTVSKTELEQLEKQLTQRIEDSGLEADEKNLNRAKWLMEKGLPVNEQNLALLQKMDQLSFPLDEERIIQNAVNALAQGKSPQKIPVANEVQDIYREAASLYERYHRLPAEAVDYAAANKLSFSLHNMEGYAQAEGNFAVQIQARKFLEEVRLKMTVEANLRLLQSGFSIDTAPMEELIVQLEQAEKQWESQLFGQDHNVHTGMTKGQLYIQTVRQISELPGLPLALAGRIPFMENPTLSRVGEEGRSLADRYQTAGESYEALMTAPRKDMGDSIQKAFQNVDAILADLNLVCNEENRRAIRILGYNRMELTIENIWQVQKADQQVQDVIEGMKPGLTLEMIRQGRNPLEMTLEELQQYILEREQDFGEETARYSKFLYKLEKQGEISQDERKAYIGLYRLFRQIEKSDGAVIGSLVAQGADLNLNNLLSAVRSRKAKPTDILVDDSVGVLDHLEVKGISISAQIEEGLAAIRRQLKADKQPTDKQPWELLQKMEQLVTDEHLEQDYAEAQLKEIRQILQQDSRQEAYLKAYQQPVTVENLQSAGVLNNERGSTFRKIRTLEEKFLAKQESLHQKKKVFGFLEKAEQFIETMEEESKREGAYQSIIESAAEVLEQTVGELGEEAASVDIKGIQQLYKQLHLVSSLATEENYEIPVQIGEELTAINLTIIRGKEAVGEVKIRLETQRLGKTEARFGIEADVVRGSVLTNTREGMDLLESNVGLLRESLTKVLEGSELELKEIWFGQGQNVSWEQEKREEPTAAYDTTLLYSMAKEWIAFVKRV